MPRLTWSKDKSDGTSYSCWTRSDGAFLIEIKRRFEGCAYQLVPMRDGQQMLSFSGSWPLPFRTLQEAKDASLWPRETLLERMRQEFAHWIAYWVRFGGPIDFKERMIEKLMEYAIEEDSDRQRMKARQAA